MSIPTREPARGAIGWLPEDAPAAVVAARGLYLLRQWPAVLATLDTDHRSAEAETVRALAWARMGEFERALASFRAAVATEPVDPHLRCAYVACLLRVGRGEDAGAQMAAADARPLPPVPSPKRRGGVANTTARVPPLRFGEGGQGGRVNEPDGPPVSLLPTIHSLHGAACWRLGQEALGQARDRDAAAQFDRAAGAFLVAAQHAATARRPLPERLAATYVGQAVAMIGAEQFAAVTQLFARRRSQGMAVSPALSRFARDLYEICDLLPRLDPSERAAAIAGLRPLVTGAGMAVQIWDGAQPVNVTWRGLVGRGERSEGASHA
jgi:hypothetical protein